MILYSKIWVGIGIMVGIGVMVGIGNTEDDSR
jgi:biotin synthase-like enzyme